MKKHYTIPFFIPHKGCPFACIFCRQDKISGREKSITPRQIAPTIKKYLSTIPAENTRVETGFFGGSFTGLTAKTQKVYLEKVLPFIKAGQIAGIRLSTRPDYIDEKKLALLKKYKVTCIELGVQSTSDRILKNSKRGHSYTDIKNASKLILENNFSLGHQIMVGLPGSTLADEIKTARQCIEMGISQVRIYPVLVIKDTELAALWKKGLYKPLTETTAIRRCAKLVQLFEQANVKVIRCGLHPSEGLISGKEILAGPFHPAFRQKVETYIYKNLFKKLLAQTRAVKKIYYNPIEASYVLGYKRTNTGYVEKNLRQKNLFEANSDVKTGTVRIVFEDGKSKTLKKY